MILQLLTTTLLLLNNGGFQVAYEQQDHVSGLVENYDVKQLATFDNNTRNLQLTYSITSGDYGTFTINGDIDTTYIDEYINSIPSYFDFVPLFWFTFENGNFVPVEENPLEIALTMYNNLYVTNVSINTLEYGYLSLNSHLGSTLDGGFYFKEALENTYVNFDYNYSNAGDGYAYHTYQCLLNSNDWNITGFNFTDLNLDLYFSIGNYKRLKEMSYSLNGLGSKVDYIYQNNSSVIYNQGFSAGKTEGYNQGLQVGQSQCDLASQNPTINSFFDVLAEAGTGIASFLAIPLLPGISLGTLIAVFVGLPLLIMLLKHLGK